MIIHLFLIFLFRNKFLLKEIIRMMRFFYFLTIILWSFMNYLLILFLLMMSLFINIMLLFLLILRSLMHEISFMFMIDSTRTFFICDLNVFLLRRWNMNLMMLVFFLWLIYFLHTLMTIFTGRLIYLLLMVSV